MLPASAGAPGVRTAGPETTTTGAGGGGTAGYWKYRQTRFLKGACSSAYQCQGTGSNGRLSGTVTYGTTAGSATYTWSWNPGAGRTMGRLDPGQVITVTAQASGSGALNLVDGLTIRMEKDDMARGTTWATAIEIANVSRPTGQPAPAVTGTLKLPAGPYFPGRNAMALRAESGAFGAVDLVYDWVPSSTGKKPQSNLPVVKAKAKGLTNPGTRGLLAFTVKDDSGKARAHLTLYEGGSPVYKADSDWGPANGKAWTYNARFAADLVGPMYFCVWAENRAGLKSKNPPDSSCNWISLLAPIARVSNGCGGKGWDELVWVENYFGNEHTYLDSNVNPLATPYTVNFAPACNIHDAGYGGRTVKDMFNRGRPVDFHDWSRKRVDDKFLKDMRKVCALRIPATATVARQKCEGVGGPASIGAEWLYNKVRYWGNRFFDADLTKPGLQKTGHRDNT